MIAELVANGLAGTSDKDRLTRAWALLSLLIGGLSITRAMRDASITDVIAQFVKAAAILAEGQTTS